MNHSAKYLQEAEIVINNLRGIAMDYIEEHNVPDAWAKQTSDDGDITVHVTVEVAEVIYTIITSSGTIFTSTDYNKAVKYLKELIRPLTAEDFPVPPMETFEAWLEDYKTNAINY